LNKETGLLPRGNTGHYKITSVGGEQVQVFIPYPLPLELPVALSHARQRLLERATLARGRMEGIARLMTLGIIKELTGGRRNRVFSYAPILRFSTKTRSRYEDTQTAGLGNKRASANARPQSAQCGGCRQPEGAWVWLLRNW
jgi:hypothetical protein